MVTGRLAPLQAVIGWTALVAVLGSVLFLGANRPAAWLALAVVVGAAFALQVVVDLAAPVRPARQRSILVPGLAMLAVIGWGWFQATPGWAPAGWVHPVWQAVDVPGAVAINPIAATHHVIRLSTYMAAFWLAARLAEDRRQAQRMIMAVALFSTALAIYGLASFIAGRNPIAEMTDFPIGALSASFVNRNSYATYAVFGMIANLAAWVLVLEHEVDNSRWASARDLVRALLNNLVDRGWWFALGFLVCLTAVAMSQSRAGAGVAVLAVVVFFLTYVRRRGIAARVTLLGVAVAAVYVGATSLGGLAARLLATSTESARFVIYPVILDALDDRLWLGHGLGGFYHAFRRYVPASVADREWDLAHNTYLENLFELGLLPALLLYGALLWIVVRIARGAWTRRRDQVFPALALACTAAAAAHSLVDFSLQMPASAALFAMILGIGWAQSFSSR